MFNLYEVGLNYSGINEYCESDFVVFSDEKEAEEYITRAAVKVMITSVTEDKIKKLQTLCTKYFKKGPEDITNEDVDGVKDIKKLYKDLTPIQDKNMGVTGFFFEKVETFTDKDNNKYEINLKLKK